MTNYMVSITSNCLCLLNSCSSQDSWGFSLRTNPTTPFPAPQKSTPPQVFWEETPVSQRWTAPVQWANRERLPLGAPRHSGKVAQCWHHHSIPLGSTPHVAWKVKLIQWIDWQPACILTFGMVKSYDLVKIPTRTAVPGATVLQVFTSGSPAGTCSEMGSVTFLWISAVAWCSCDT